MECVGGRVPMSCRMIIISTRPRPRHAMETVDICGPLKLRKDQKPFLGSFANLRKSITSFVMSVCPSVWINLAPTGRIFMKFGICLCFENLPIKFAFGYNLTRIRLLMYVRLSVHMDQLGSNWRDFHEIWYLPMFRKFAYKIRVWLQFDKNKIINVCPSVRPHGSTWLQLKGFS
jgi:hypothetical protein